MANTKDDLLVLFTPNDTNNIQAAYLQQFVVDIYAQAVLIDEIVDALDDDQGTKRVLSASRGYWLNELIKAQQLQIDDLLARVSALETP